MMTKAEATKAGRAFRDANPFDYSWYRSFHRATTGTYGTLADYAYYRMTNGYAPKGAAANAYLP